jgi:hypothetical protein
MARINSEGSTPESGGKVARQSQKLTEERRARKRELDRQAQRCARMKTKNHIAQLEEQIESLKAINLSGSAKTLMIQLEEQKKQNEILRSKLKAIVKLAGGEMDGSCKDICIEGSVVAFTDTLKLRRRHPNRRGPRDSQPASQTANLRYLCLQPIPIQIQITIRMKNSVPQRSRSNKKVFPKDQTCGPNIPTIRSRRKSSWVLSVLHYLPRPSNATISTSTTDG